LTLALSALGFVIVAQRPIEAAIAASIVLLAYETLTDRQSLSHRFPALVAFSFGLIHGLGFAGALSEIGLPEGSRLGALLLFNIGIEIGQIAIVVGVLIALRALPLRRLPLPTQTWLRSLPAVAIGGVASYWFIERALSIVLPLIS
ncbi:MAG: HupE/UreJ family protein, partial [Gammaproteobacteria bacterium]|nr:HupE/UreJ family protein [Gammaproteobacteria bacterium]